MDPALQTLATVAISAVSGGAFTQFITYLTTRGDKKAAREDAQAAAQVAANAAQAAANDKLAADLRDEQRRDNLALRERMSTLEGQVIELNKTNESLRRENLSLVEKNGQQAYQLSVQAGQLEAQAIKIKTMQATLDALRDHNTALEAAMKAANIPVPDTVRRVPDTGPLALAAAD